MRRRLLLLTGWLLLALTACSSPAAPPCSHHVTIVNASRDLLADVTLDGDYLIPEDSLPPAASLDVGELEPGTIHLLVAVFVSLEGHTATRIDIRSFKVPAPCGDLTIRYAW